MWRTGFQQSRRELLQRWGTGFGVLGLAGALADAGDLVTSGAPRTVLPLSPKQPPSTPCVRHVVHLFMNGGPSHVDTFDPKPMLDKYHGRSLPTENLRTERKTGHAMRSPFEFRKYGESGIEVSQLFAETAKHVDDLCVIRSMVAEVPNHEPSHLLMNCGNSRLAVPSMGAWVTYGLGTENQNLPGFIVMCPNGYPLMSTRNWRSAFLPGAYQGTFINSKEENVHRLIANVSNTSTSPDEQRRGLDLVRQMNERHQRFRHDDPRLEARIQSFELAFRMQSEAVEAFDISGEPRHVQDSYGVSREGRARSVGRQLLMTRRLIERGVRFVQLWAGDNTPWDSHEKLEENHRSKSAEWDLPIAAFLSDLKQRGLFEETLVLWGGEFGRTPVAEYPSLDGRDHNHYGFSCWLAGGGVRGGQVYGATDEFGFRAVERPVTVHDLHATMLHLLGFDHEKMTYRYAGRDFRLTDIHGKVLHDLIV